MRIATLTGSLVIALLCSVLPEAMRAAQPEWSVAVDVPTTLGGADRTPEQILRTDGTAYALEATLPPGTHISALYLHPDGRYLFSPSHPVNLGGVDYEPRDVIASDGATFTVVLDGSTIGIPEGARIDGLQGEGAGVFQLSFDAPVRLGETDYGRSDIVRWSPEIGFSLFFDAQAAGVPDYANVVGVSFDDDAGTSELAFDVPTRLDGADHGTGQVVSWSGAGFAPSLSHPGWPPYAQIRALSLYPPAGEVPDGGSLPGTPMSVETLPGGEIRLTWDGACLTHDPVFEDFAVYEGTLANFASHAPRLCSTQGARESSFTPAGGNTYYLVVPVNAWREGSLGRRSDGSERPRGASACLPQSVASTCE
jgi:hypothetical protein